MIVEVKGHTIEVFDSIDELGILRFHKFNKYQMQANEVGSDFADYEARTEQTYKFLQKKMFKEAIKELNNRRLTVFNAYNNNPIRGKAFAVMIKQIDDKRYNGTGQDEIKEILNHLERIGLSYIKSMEILIDVKKNSKPNYKSILRKISKIMTN